MLESGIVLSGRYRLEERIATGGMGDVWRGTDLLLGRRVAVKVLLPALLVDSDFIARFRAEARMLAALRHPGVVQVFDSGEDTLPTGEQADYLVMEYVEGEPLSERIRATQRLTIAETMSVVTQVGRALHAAHLKGIVHRDVKPSNLLVQADGTVRLLDFGVARSVNITSITSVNAVPGTALYMAPEQAAGQPVSAATDIYALGAVAYHCVTGDPPFTGENPLQIAVKHLHDDLAALPEDVPGPVAGLIERALAKAPADRYPSAEALAEAAAAIASGRAEPAGAGVRPAGTVRAPTPGPVDPGRDGPGRTGGTLSDNPVVVPPDRPRRRARTLAGIALAVGLVGTGVALLVAFQPSGQSPTTDGPPPTASASAQNPEATAPGDGPGSATAESPRPARTEGQSDPRPTLSGSPTSTPDPDTQPTTEAPETSEPTDPEPTPSETEAGGDPGPSGSADPDGDR